MPAWIARSEFCGKRFSKTQGTQMWLQLSAADKILLEPKFSGDSSTESFRCQWINMISIKAISFPIISPSQQSMPPMHKTHTHSQLCKCIPNHLVYIFLFSCHEIQWWTWDRINVPLEESTRVSSAWSILMSLMPKKPKRMWDQYDQTKLHRVFESGQCQHHKPHYKTEWKSQVKSIGI